MSYTIGIDIGGTFTDTVAVDRETGRIYVGKALTTPDDRSRGFFESIDAAAEQIGTDAPALLQECALLVHGTTTGTNAIVTRSGARVGILATAGHGDVMYLMRGGGRTAGLAAESLLHLPSTGKPDPLVPKGRIVEIAERIDVDGDVVVPLDEEGVADAVRLLVAEGVEAIAISFLWSVMNGEHERRAAEIARALAPDAYVTCGSELTSHVGEYERTTTAAMNAYVGPLMNRYIAAIERGTAERGFRGTLLFAHCAGGAMNGNDARHAPIQTVNSGPVAGVGSAELLGQRAGEPNLITADMGGTSCDVCIIEGGAPLARQTSMLARYEVALPTLDVESIGAGGGSIAWIDSSGRLEVGPKSAGSTPGPVCYDRGGTEPTVTDADVVLGLIDPDLYLGGRLKLNVDRAEQAIARVGDQLGLTLPETAAGIARLVDSKMADLIRRVSTMRGFDPRSFACLAFGGGGPLHIGRAAHEAGIPRIMVPVPRLAALWSALGAATADILHVSHTPLELTFEEDSDTIARTIADMRREAGERLSGEGFSDGSVSIDTKLTARYTRQVHSLDVPVPEGPVNADEVRALRDAFDMRYETMVGSGAGYREGGTTVTGAIVTARGRVHESALHFGEPFESGREPERRTRSVYWDELRDFAATPVWRLAGAPPPERIEGPALLELASTVIVVRPGASGAFDRDGNFVMTY